MIRPFSAAAAGLALVLAAACSPASAAVDQKSGAFGGLQIQYLVSTPPGYDPAKTYPVVLLFGGGGQTLQATQGAFDEMRPEADKRGYVLVAPIAPDFGHLYFEDGDRIFPDFLQMIRRDYHATGKIHIAGRSNGGLSAFHIAGLYPDAFSTVTGYPGLINDPGFNAARLKGACLFMHAGEMDPDWANPMRRQADELKRGGFKVAYTLELGQGHGIHPPDIAQRLFDEIESCG